MRVLVVRVVLRIRARVCVLRIRCLRVLRATMCLDYVYFFTTVTVATCAVLRKIPTFVGDSLVLRALASIRYVIMVLILTKTVLILILILKSI